MTVALLSGNVSHQEGTGEKASIYFDIAKFCCYNGIPFYPFGCSQKDSYFSL